MGLLGTEAQDVHLDFHTAPELCIHHLLKCCFTSTETVGLLGTGAQDGHLDFHTAPELWNDVSSYGWLYTSAVGVTSQNKTQYECLGEAL